MRIDARIILVNVIVIALAVSAYMSLNSVRISYPLNGMVTDDRSPTFRWAGPSGSYELLIDDDPDFSSPMEFRAAGNSMRLGQELDFGTYWFKVRKGGAESQPGRFTVVSSVEVARPESSLLKNTGNAELLVRGGGLTGAVTLAVNRTVEISGDEGVNAEQK